MATTPTTDTAPTALEQAALAYADAIIATDAALGSDCSDWDAAWANERRARHAFIEAANQHPEVRR